MLGAPMAVHTTMNIIARTLAIPLTAACLAAQDPDPVAAARLLETQGKLQEAEQVLRDALAAPDAGDKSTVAVAFARLLALQGRADELLGGVISGAKDSDPITDLIAQLDRGSLSADAVNSAYLEISSLGAMAIPRLVAALPDLGPFGQRNAIDLLLRQQQLPQAERAIRLFIEREGAEALGPASTRWSLTPAIARQLAVSATSVELQYAAFDNLTDSPEDAALREQLARTILDAGEPKVVQRLLRDMPSDAPWAKPLLETTLDDPDTPPSTRHVALDQWLEHHAESESEAIARIERLDVLHWKVRLAMTAVASHPDWTSLARLGADWAFAIQLDKARLRGAAETFGAQFTEAARRADDWNPAQTETVVGHIALANDEATLDLAVRAFRQLPTNWLAEFIGRWQSGEPELVAVADLSTWENNPTSIQLSLSKQLAEQAARRVRAGDLAALLEMLPRLHEQIARVVYEVLRGSPTADTGPRPDDSAKILLASLQRLEAAGRTHGWDAPLPGLGPNALSIGTHLGATIQLIRPTELSGCAEGLAAFVDSDAPMFLRQRAAKQLMAPGHDHTVPVVRKLLDPLAGKSPTRWGPFWGLIPDSELADDEMARLAVQALRRSPTSEWAPDLFPKLPTADAAPLAVEILAADVSSWNERVRRQALAVVADAGNTIQLDLLAGLVDDPSWSFRETLAWTLGRRYEQAAAAPLLELLKDERSNVRDAARDALTRLEEYLDQKEAWDSRKERGR